jgi:hypothetical protein
MIGFTEDEQSHASSAAERGEIDASKGKGASAGACAHGISNWRTTM